MSWLMLILALAFIGKVVWSIARLARFALLGLVVLMVVGWLG